MKILKKFFSKRHDCFLIIGKKVIFHLGATLKDLAKKWFAFSKPDQGSVKSIISEINKCFPGSNHQKNVLLSVA